MPDMLSDPERRRDMITSDIDVSKPVGVIETVERPQVEATPHHGLVRLLQGGDIQLVGLLAFWLALGALFDVLTGGLFFTPLNLASLGQEVATLGVVSIAVSMVIIMGQFDLAIGGAVALTGAILGELLIVHNWPIPAAFAFTLAVGLVLGALEGILIVQMTRLQFAVASFIVTLGGMLAYPGLTVLILPDTVSPFPEFVFNIATTALRPPWAYLAIVAVAAATYILASPRGPLVWFIIVLSSLVLAWVATTQGIPTLVLIVIVLVFVVEFVMQKTIYGRYLYAIGGNREAARLNGINVNKFTLIAFVAMGAFYALAGLMASARLDAASPQVDQSLALNGIAAAAIGGVSLLGGRGRPARALIGALILGTLINGFDLMNFPSLWQMVASGPILVLAVWVDLYLRQRQRHRQRT